MTVLQAVILASRTEQLCWTSLLCITLYTLLLEFLDYFGLSTIPFLSDQARSMSLYLQVASLYMLLVWLGYRSGLFAIRCWMRQLFRNHAELLETIHFVVHEVREIFSAELEEFSIEHRPKFSVWLALLVLNGAIFNRPYYKPAIEGTFHQLSTVFREYFFIMLFCFVFPSFGLLGGVVAMLEQYQRRPTPQDWATVIQSARDPSENVGRKCHILISVLMDEMYIGSYWSQETTF